MKFKACCNPRLKPGENEKSTGRLKLKLHPERSGLKQVVAYAELVQLVGRHTRWSLEASHFVDLYTIVAHLA